VLLSKTFEPVIQNAIIYAALGTCVTTSPKREKAAPKIICCLVSAWKNAKNLLLAFSDTASAKGQKFRGSYRGVYVDMHKEASGRK